MQEWEKAELPEVGKVEVPAALTAVTHAALLEVRDIAECR